MAVVCRVTKGPERQKDSTPFAFLGASFRANPEIRLEKTRKTQAEQILIPGIRWVESRVRILEIAPAPAPAPARYLPVFQMLRRWTRYV